MILALIRYIPSAIVDLIADVPQQPEAHQLHRGQ